ncbi:MAG: InlB B-repeat-containing protein [Clostridiales bacterium]|nr:InlB B-repeat-containing protein [Clostridiales bacterium]
MQRSIRNKLFILAGIVCVALLCVTCFTVSFAAWQIVSPSTTVDGSAALLYVDYPNVVANITEEIVEPECPADNSKSKKFVFSDGAKIVFVGLNYSASISCHIWKSNSATTTWPGTTLDGGTYNCNWNIAETKGIIFINGSGNSNRTGDDTAFFSAHFSDGLKDNYIYTIDFTKLNSCSNTTTSATLKTNIPVQSRESKETKTEISHGEENKLVREVKANQKDVFHNYVCVSRTEKYDESGELVAVTDPSFAYVNFSVKADDEQALEAPVKSFTVTRRRTDENGVPISGTFDVPVYGSPIGGTLEDINDKTYIMLDFGLGSERFNALDFQIETETAASYTLSATATFRDNHTYQVANSCYLGFGDWTMREPVLMSGLVESNYVDVSVTATLTEGDGFKMFGSGSGSGGSISIAKYFGAENYKFSEGIESNFTVPSNAYGADSDIIVNTSGRYLIRYYGAIKNISGSDWSVENVEITLLTGSEENDPIVITCENDLSKLDGITAAELYSTPIVLDIADESDPLYGRSLTIITSAADLAVMEGNVKSNAYYYQSNDIDTAPASSLYTSETPFGGIYNGGGHTVETVSVASGLFGYIGTCSTVKNLTVAVNITNDTSVNYFGGIASVNDGSVIGVTVNGSIVSTRGTVNTDAQKTTYATGGIVGKNSGTVENCTNNATVTGHISVGGIVGYNMAGATVTNCSNTALIGTTSTTVNMTGYMSWAGGLVGYNAGTVSRSINGGNVSAYKGNNNSDGNGNNFLSGLVAENAASGVVTECINTGNVYGDYAIAGFASLNYGTIEYCINTGDVEARWEASGGTCQGDSGAVKNSIMRGGVTASQNTTTNPKYAVIGAGAATDCYYVNGSAPTGTGNTGNAKYDIGTIDKVIAMLDVLGDKFAYDGENVTLAYLVDAAKLTFTVKDAAYKTINIMSGITLDLTQITEPTDAQFAFRGWYLAGDEEKTHITEYTVNGDAGFVADMGKKQFTVAFYVDDGDEVWHTVTADYDEEITPPDNPTKDGYTFGGWFEDGAEDPFDFAQERSGNVSLRAKWTANTYTVTFDPNDGDVEPTEKEVTYNSAFGELPTPTRDGYRFGGWYTQKGEEDTDDGWGDCITADSVMVFIDDITLYAKWRDENSAITSEAELLELLAGKTIDELNALTINLEVEDTDDHLYGKTAIIFVSTEAELKSITADSTNYYYQTNDITASSLSTLLSTDFNGVYNGNGHTVSKVTAARGLFGTIGSNGIVKNLTVNVQISSGTQDYIGGVAAVNNGKVLNATVTGSISSTIGTVNTGSQKTLYGTGGIVGKNRASGVISGCTNNATLSGRIVVGGIVGYNMSGATVTNCTNNGAIGSTSTSMSWAGGLAGLNNGTVSCSINTAGVNATRGSDGSGNGCNYIAGLVGENDTSGILTECINNGNVQCDYAASGMTGINNGAVEYCINTGSATARWSACGGSVEGTGTFNRCVFTGTVAVTGGGGAYAVKNGSSTYCYYVSGTAPSGTGNATYSASNKDSMLSVLGDKFAWDETNNRITLAFTIN